MIKKGLLAFVLVFLIVTVTNATVIDVVTDGLSNYGCAGTLTDPLHTYGETIEIKLVLNHNPYPDYPSYDGYLLSSMDTMLSVSGPGTLEQKVGKNPWATVPGNEIQLQDLYLTPLRGPIDIPLLAIDLRIVAVGMGFITLDLSINGQSEYAPYVMFDGINPYPDPPGWVSLIGSDLGDLALHSNAIPEPATILILGLGSLLLRRKY